MELDRRGDVFRKLCAGDLLAITGDTEEGWCELALNFGMYYLSALRHECLWSDVTVSVSVPAADEYVKRFHIECGQSSDYLIMVRVVATQCTPLDTCCSSDILF